MSSPSSTDTPVHEVGETLSFCTLFDRNFLDRGLVMIESIRHHVPDARIHVLCLDPQTKTELATTGMPELDLIDLEAYHHFYPTLTERTSDRSRAEYIFTCTGCLSHYVLTKSSASLVIYVDADTCFFSDMGPVLSEMTGHSIGVTPHDFANMGAYRRRFGVFNVGFEVFRNDGTGRRCAQDWAEQCLDWCYERLEPHRYAEQKYLDRWPDAYEGVKTLRSTVNIAPWSRLARRIRQEADGRFTIDGQPLIHFHFSSVKFLGDRTWDFGFSKQLLWPGRGLKALYRHYINLVYLHEAYAMQRMAQRGSTRTSNLRQIVMGGVERVMKLLFRDRWVIEKQSCNQLGKGQA